MLWTALRDSLRERGWEERKRKRESPPPPLTPPQKHRTNTRWESRSLWQLTSGLQGESHTSPRLPQLARTHTHMLGGLQCLLWVDMLVARIIFLKRSAELPHLVKVIFLRSYCILEVIQICNWWPGHITFWWAGHWQAGALFIGSALDQTCFL